MGSDGVWDNLFDEDIQHCVKSQLKNQKLLNLQHVSNCISTFAEVKGYDADYLSPFAMEARKTGRKRYSKSVGGKPDDITVIVAQVQFKDQK